MGSTDQAALSVDTELAEIAGRIRQWRGEARLTLAELAHRSGIATGTIQKIETMQMVPSVAVLVKIARGLGRSPGTFFAVKTPAAGGGAGFSRRPVRKRPDDGSAPGPDRSPNQVAKRDQIVSATVKLLLRDGVHGCTARSIASSAGMSKGAVHYYFGDVDEIVDLAMLEATRGWIAWLGEKASPKPADAATPSAAFWRVVSACLEPFAQGDRTLMPLWLEYWALCTRANRLDALRAVQGLLESYVRELLQAAAVPDPAGRAVAVTSYLIGTGMHELMQPVPPQAVQRHVAALSGIDPAPR